MREHRQEACRPMAGFQVCVLATGAWERRRKALPSALVLLGLAPGIVPHAAAAAPDDSFERYEGISLQTVSSSGTQGNNVSYKPFLSGDGGIVTFYSRSDNLVPGDTNGVYDIFVRDARTGATSLASVGYDGSPANGPSYSPSITPDGRYVAFRSWASNLVPYDTNYAIDVFVYDTWAGTTERVNLVDGSGAQGDGDTGLSPGDSWTIKDGFYPPSMSADGRYVAFASGDDRLVDNDKDGVTGPFDVEAWDVFVRDRQTGRTILVSIGHDGSPANDISDEPTISSDGRYVAFRSFASNLVPSDRNGTGSDAFVYDLQTGAMELVSLSSPDVVDGNGNRFRANSRVYPPTISGNGRYVCFPTQSSSLLGGYWSDGDWIWNDSNGYDDLYVHDRQTGLLTRISVSSSGAQGNFSSYWCSLSADGRFGVFSSLASNLVAGDTNATRDIFVHDLQTGETDGGSTHLSMNVDGQHIAFDSQATNLADETDVNGAIWDIFRTGVDRVKGLVFADSTTLAWDEIKGAAYDVISGALATLAIAGDYSTAVDTCEAAGLADNQFTLTDGRITRFYLVRAVVGTRIGSYDAVSAGQVGGRDSGVRASGEDCP